MSQGLLLLRAICDSGSRSALRIVSEDLFLEDERPAYQFILNYYRSHGQYPTQEALEDENHDLGTTSEPYTYHLEQCQRRHIHNSIAHRFSELQSTLTVRGREYEAINIVSEMLRDARRVDQQFHGSDIAHEAESFLEQYQQRKRIQGLPGIPLGYAVLDEQTGGAMPGDVIVYVGRINVGKSYMLLHAMNTAWSAGFVPLCVSMEMSLQQIVTRQIAIRAGINPRYVRFAQLDSWSEQDMRSAIREFRDMPPLHYLSGNFRKSVDDIDLMVQERAPDIVYIDAGYLVDPGRHHKHRHDKQWEKIVDVITDLKVMAMSRNVPVIVTVQFNRNFKASNSNRDLDALAKIGGADAIGQQATIVVTIQHGVGQRRESTRILSNPKSRESEVNKRWLIHYTFSPPCFEHIQDIEDDGPILGEAGHEETIRRMI